MASSRKKGACEGSSGGIEELAVRDGVGLLVVCAGSIEGHKLWYCVEYAFGMSLETVVRVQEGQGGCCRRRRRRRRR